MKLSPAQKQLVEIAKAISRNARILIMDEPSAPLSASEVETMFEIIGKLKSKGVTIIYISHRIEELFRISDRVTVMRDGRYIDTLVTKQTNRKELINLMVGRELKEYYPKRTGTPGEVVLEVKNIYPAWATRTSPFRSEKARSWVWLDWSARAGPSLPASSMAPCQRRAGRPGSKVKNGRSIPPTRRSNTASA